MKNAIVVFYLVFSSQLSLAQEPANGEIQYAPAIEHSEDRPLYRPRFVYPPEAPPLSQRRQHQVTLKVLERVRAGEGTREDMRELAKDLSPTVIETLLEVLELKIPVASNSIREAAHLSLLWNLPPDMITPTVVERLLKIAIMTTDPLLRATLGWEIRNHVQSWNNPGTKFANDDQTIKVEYDRGRIFRYLIFDPRSEKVQETIQILEQRERVANSGAAREH